jgi:flagellar basal body P-ring protein FlgI
MPQFIHSQITVAKLALSAVLLCLLALPLGCNLLPGKGEKDSNTKLQELMKVPKLPDLIREATMIQGLQPIQVIGVGVVNGLPNTGGPANPSQFRDELLEEMKRRDIKDPNHFLELNNTALVRIQATIPPGDRRNDPVDLIIRAPNESVVSDLNDGWLLDTRLRQQRFLQNKIRKSEVMAIGTGPVLTRGSYTPGEDGTLKTEGTILSGGRIQITRKLGLVLSPEYQHAKTSSALAAAINRRFFFFDGTTRLGIAKAKEDDFLEMETHPRYRNNIPRMMAVIQAISTAPESSATQIRLSQLASKLSDPTTAADAALQLEAMGESAVPILLDALNSTNPELRFYAAESLAYLDRTEAIESLETAIRETAAFRHPSLLALQGMDHQLAIDALQRLMNEASIETRYGSFCAIRRQGIEGKSILGGQALKSFYLYQIPSTPKPAVVVSLRESPEIVLFGDSGKMEIPQFLRGPNGLILKPDLTTPGKLKISRFQVNADDKRVTVSDSLASVISGIVAVGGGYGDVISILRMAKAKGYLSDQLAIDPLPAAVRVYHRNEETETTTDDASNKATAKNDTPDSSVASTANSVIRE